jgi:hypothetical protein
VLDAVAAALQLSVEERSHLYNLAWVVDRTALAGSPAGAARAARAPGEERGAPAAGAPAAGAPAAEPPGRPSGARPGSGAGPMLPSTVQLMFDAVGSTPAFAVDRLCDVVALNCAARFLYADFDAMPACDRNTLVWMLCDPAARRLYGPAWEQVATQMIGFLRREAGREPGHPRIGELVRRLSADSSLFREAWQQHDVGNCAHAMLRLYHPAGTLDFVTDEVTAASDKGITFLLLIPLDPAAFAAVLDRHTRPESA